MPGLVDELLSGGAALVNGLFRAIGLPSPSQGAAAPAAGVLPADGPGGVLPPEPRHGAGSAIVRDHFPRGGRDRVPTPVTGAPPKFTDIGQVAGQAAQAKDISGGVATAGAAVGAVLGVPEVGKVAAKVGDIVGSVLATGNAAGLSPQQMAYVTRPDGSIDADRLMQVEGKTGTKSADLIPGIAGGDVIELGKNGTPPRLVGRGGELAGAAADTVS